MTTSVFERSVSKSQKVENGSVHTQNDEVMVTMVTSITLTGGDSATELEVQPHLDNYMTQ